MVFIICLLIAYALGSVSTSIMLAKLMGKKDPRSEGSGNAGATNVLRTSGKKDAIMVLVGDILKGLIAVWLAKSGGVHGFALGLIAVAAVVGHIFPVFFGFKGGKGVATSLGVILGLSFMSAIICIAVFVVVVYVTKYVSLGSLLAAAVAPFALLIFASSAYFIPGVVLALLIIWKHQANVQRLKAGTENKLKL